MSSQVRTEWGPSQHRETLSSEPVSPAQEQGTQKLPGCRSSGSECGDGSSWCVAAVLLTSPSLPPSAQHVHHTRSDRMAAGRSKGEFPLQYFLKEDDNERCALLLQVCQCWRRLAARMNLSCYVGYIQSQEKSNSASLRLLLRLWSSAKPDSYNVKGLKRVLAAEVSVDC